MQDYIAYLEPESLEDITTLTYILADAAPDLRYVRLDERLAVWVRLKLRLADGCCVLGIGPRGKRKVGRYIAGSPKQFAEFVDPFDGKALRRKVPLSSLGARVRVVAIARKCPR